MLAQPLNLCSSFRFRALKDVSCWARCSDALTLLPIAELLSAELNFGADMPGTL